MKRKVKSKKLRERQDNITTTYFGFVELSGIYYTGVGTKSIGDDIICMDVRYNPDKYQLSPI